MKFLTQIAPLVALAALATTSVNAALITYNFVPTAAPTPGGGEFVAQVAFDSSLLGAGPQLSLPSTFSASLTGNKFYPNRTWELDEIFLNAFDISSSGTLTYSLLLSWDNDKFGFGNLLTGDNDAFFTPVYVPGNWVQSNVTTAPPTGSVPEGGPGCVAAITFIGMGVVAHRQRRKRLTQS